MNHGMKAMPWARSFAARLFPGPQAFHHLAGRNAACAGSGLQVRPSGPRLVEAAWRSDAGEVSNPGRSLAGSTLHVHGAEGSP